MAHRAQAILLLSVAILVGLFLSTSPTSAADPTPVACPNGQTVFIRGKAPAGESLLLYLGGRAVGGGLADRSGAYSIPLRVQERPGSYPGEVRLRSSRAVVDRFTCFVDIPLGAESTTSTAAATSPATTPARGTPIATPRIVATPTGTATGSPTAGTSTPSTSPTVTPTGPTATPTTTGTAGPSPTPTTTGTAGPSPTPTSTVAASAVRIIDVVIYDPAFPNSAEYVQITSNSRRDISLSGWRLVNASRSAVPPFVFPSFTLKPDATVVVWSDTDTNDPDSGDFYWNQQPPVWRAGDRAELRDAQNNLVQAFTVEK